MRITNQSFVNEYTQNTNEAKAQIANLQQRISSGKGILKPSDDPVSAGKVVNITQTLGQLDQYARNGDYADSRLTMEESALSAIASRLVSIREIALRSNNDTLKSKDQETLLQDVALSHTEILNLLNSMGPNGEYLFSGTDRQTRPIEQGSIYNGNMGSQLINIGLNQKVRVGTPAPELISYSSNNESLDLISTITDFMSLMDLAASDNKPIDYHNQVATTIEHLDDAHSHILAKQADTGHRLAHIDVSRTDNADIELMLSADLEDLEGVDLPEAISKLEAELQSLEAIQKTYARLNQMSLFSYI